MSKTLLFFLYTFLFALYDTLRNFKLEALQLAWKFLYSLIGILEVLCLYRKFTLSKRRRAAGYPNISLMIPDDLERTHCKEKHIQFELFKSPTATIEKKNISGPNSPNRSVFNTTYYFLTYSLKANVLFGKNRNWKKDHLTSSK